MKRAVRSILRLVAFGSIMVGGLEFVLEFLRHRVRHAEFSLWHCVIGGVLIGLGVVLWLFSAKLAERWTSGFDE